MIRLRVESKDLLVELHLTRHEARALGAELAEAIDQATDAATKVTACDA